jgi:hypothetical protein
LVLLFALILSFKCFVPPIELLRLVSCSSIWNLVFYFLDRFDELIMWEIGAVWYYMEVFFFFLRMGECSLLTEWGSIMFTFQACLKLIDVHTFFSPFNIISYYAQHLNRLKIFFLLEKQKKFQHHCSSLTKTKKKNLC